MGSESFDGDAERKDVNLFEGRKGAAQRFSRFDEYSQRQQRGGNQTTVVTQRALPTRTLSSVPTNDGYTLSSTNHSNNGRPINSNNGIGSKTTSIMYSPMRSSHTPSTFRSSRASSTNGDTEDESGVQFMGKFANGNARSRSNSSTASVKTYGNSAARRYSAQSSPAPVRRSVGRSVEKSREQWPLNVNQLNAVPTQQLLQKTQYQQFQSHYNGSPTQTTPNFYYSARNTSNPPNNYDKIRINRSMEKYLQQPMDPFNGVPSKRMAYEDSEPKVLNCQPLDNEFQCEDLSRLAPYVPGEDILLEDLDLESMYPGLDFSEFFPSEIPCNPPPQMNQPQQTDSFKHQTLIDSNVDLYGRQMNVGNQTQQYPMMMAGADQSLTEDWGFNQY